MKVYSRYEQEQINVCTIIAPSKGFLRYRKRTTGNDSSCHFFMTFMTSPYFAKIFVRPTIAILAGVVVVTLCSILLCPALIVFFQHIQQCFISSVIPNE